jgi:prepilin-type N-terminal cleavage/methylation domain-containing protein
MKKLRSFTLVEMIVALAILAVLVSVFVPRLVSAVEKSKGAGAKDILLKFYMGYQRLMDDGEMINSSAPFSYIRAGMSTDPNAAPAESRHFDYTFLPNANNANEVRATRIGNASATITINLNTGVITGVAPYV